MGQIFSTDFLVKAAQTELSQGAPWAQNLRGRGLSAFSELGLPHRKFEDWKYSDLSRALRDSRPDTERAVQAAALSNSYRMTFRNGKLETNLADLPIKNVSPLPVVLADGASPFAVDIGNINPQSNHPIINLNTAHMNEGVVVYLPKGEKLSTPLHIQYHWQKTEDAPLPQGHIRVVIVMEDDSEATLIESHLGCPAFASVVTELRLAPRARFNHLRLEQLAPSGRQAAVLLGSIDQAADYNGFYLSEGGHFSRHEALLDLSGEYANVTLNGVFLAVDESHCDNHVVISHSAPDTTSKQTFRGVLSGQANGVYSGCVKVAQAAQRTDAQQMSRALLLSRKARIATKPELEIFADDVKCSHGATAGELDAAALFFLRARGIPEREARALLISAFLESALLAIDDTPQRDLVSSIVENWLASHANEVNHVD